MASPGEEFETANQVKGVSNLPRMPAKQASPSEILGQLVLIRDREKRVFAQTKRVFGPNRTVFELKPNQTRQSGGPEFLVLLALRQTQEISPVPKPLYLI
jgi:hypothetical protein